MKGDTMNKLRRLQKDMMIQGEFDVADRIAEIVHELLTEQEIVSAEKAEE